MKNLLIVKLSSLGDVIHTLPAAQALRQAYPEAHLAWAVDRAHAAVLHDQPWLNEVIEHDRRSLRTYSQFIRRLRRTNWDAAIDFQGLFRSSVTTWLSGAPRRVGYSPGREWSHWFYNDRAASATLEQHAVDRYYQLASHLGGWLDGMPLVRPYLTGDPPRPWHNGPRLFPLPVGDADRLAAAQWLAGYGCLSERQRLVVLHAHARRSANLWPASQFAQLARLLHSRGNVQVVVTGGPQAKSICDEVAARSGVDVWRADGQLSLMASVELIRRAAVMVTCDSGPMHLAASVGTPIVALFGATNPLRTGPYCTNAIAIDRCLPCGHCKGKTCPRKLDPPQCMVEIGVEEVFAAVQRQLSLHCKPLHDSPFSEHPQQNSLPFQEFHTNTPPFQGGAGGGSLSSPHFPSPEKSAAARVIERPFA